MDFKFDDFIDENESNNRELPNSYKKKKNKKEIPASVAIITSLLIGFIVFLVTDAIINKKVEPEKKSKVSIDVNDQTVQTLYSYVTYGTSGIRNDKFIKEDIVDISSFNNEEKFYYALQFAKLEDFTTDNIKNNQNQVLYYIPDTTIRKYMEKFFGPDIKYQTDSLITNPFNFQVANQNIGMMTYINEKKSFETVFYGISENKNTKVIKPYYTKLVEASKNTDDLTYELKEKIVYTSVEKDANNTYKVSVFKDYNHGELIESRNNLTEAQLTENLIRIDNYLEQAKTITYNFKTNNDNIYFYNSIIENSNKSAE